MNNQQDIARQISSYITNSEEEMIKTLEKLVRTESPSKQPEVFPRILDFLSKELNVLGYEAFRFPGKNTGGFLFAHPKKRRKHNPVQLLVGHCDTVWKTDTLLSMPFQEAEDRISGPGAYDMKAGITQILYALKTLKVLKLKPELTPVIFINTDEEIGSRESKKALARLARIARRAFILEPPLGPEGKLKTERKGVGRFLLKVKGKAAHAGLDPEKGISAIVELSHQVQKLYAMNDPDRGITVNVGMISGGVSPNVIAPESSAEIDVRVNNEKDGAWITKKILGLTPDLPDSELYIEGGIGRQPMEATARNRALWEAAKKNGNQLGLNLNHGKAGGGSDGNITSLYTATLDGLGTPGDGAHAPHEYIFKSGLIERTALLTLLLLEPDLKPDS
ncbi:M20 family metallopeptidase [Robertkochia flava]|uniref:M20 family metallopeptidase n=1 Tax=Robertkochia flava TaxID=3447986 RepID=UPI001CCE97D6|nr:M20 family metallopeptidase [Robertkochia marina]